MTPRSSAHQQNIMSFCDPKSGKILFKQKPLLRKNIPNGKCALHIKSWFDLFLASKLADKISKSSPLPLPEVSFPIRDKNNLDSRESKNVGGTEHWRIHQQFFTTKEWVVYRHEWCIGNHGLPMTGLGEFIRKSRSAYEEIQTSKASSLKAASFGIFFAKRAIFVKT